MIEPPESLALLMLFVGLVVLTSVPLRAGLSRWSLPGMAGFIALGFLMSWADASVSFVTPKMQDGIDMLAQLGIVALLFRVGLESDLSQLAGQLRRAVGIWAFAVVVPASLVFALIMAWPGLDLIPAILMAIAASATSIGVSISVWEEAGKVGTQEGALLLDVAELDDLSAVVLLGIVVAVLATMQNGARSWGFGDVLWAGSLQLVKIAGFCAACYAFSRFFERRLTSIFKSLDDRVGPFVFAVGTVFLIAAFAEKLGLSVAIGALFAGLAFSKDPEERQIDQAFAHILAIFGPFFFVSIGLSVSFDRIGEALLLTLALLATLIIGKMLGAGLATWAVTEKATGVLIGASMIPRAEIYLILMLHGLSLGPWAIPPVLYSAAVLASFGTCIVGPLMVARLMGVGMKKDQVA